MHNGLDIIKNYNFGINVDKTGAGGFYKFVPVDSIKIIQKQDSLELIKLKKEREKRNIVTSNLSIEANFGEETDVNYDIINDKKISQEEKEFKIKQRNEFYKKTHDVYQFITSKLGWINIDKVLNFEVQNNYKFNSKKEFDLYSVSIIYLDSKSYIEEFVSEEFNTIPIKIRGKVKVVVYTNNETTILYDSFYLDKNSKLEIDLNLKNTTISKLKETLITP